MEKIKILDEARDKVEVEKVCKNCKYYECVEYDNDLITGYAGYCKFMPNPVRKCKFDWCGQFVEKPVGTKNWELIKNEK